MGELVVNAEGKVRVPRLRLPRLTLGVGGTLAAAWLILLAVLAVTAPLLPIANPNATDLFTMFERPGATYWFGADSLGRDLFSRVIYGAQISFLTGLGSVGLGLAVGGVIGVLAGYYRGWVDRFLMGLMNVLLAFPTLVLAILLIATLGASLLNVIAAIGVVFIPAFARIARANTLVFREQEFVIVARTLGARDFRILTREILPNLVGPLLSYSVVMFSVAVLAEASLGFLGLSIPPPAPSWGTLVSGERAYLDTAPHVIFMPALVLFITVVALNVLGERLQRVFDVREAAI